MALNPKQQLFVEEYLRTNDVNVAQDASDYRLTEWRCSNLCYVYLLIDPRNRQIFYVGKGTGKRCFSHLSEWQRGKTDNPEKLRRITDIAADGVVPTVAIFEDNLSDSNAYAVEEVLIRGIGRTRLTNAASGIMSYGEKQKAGARLLLEKMMPYDLYLRLRQPSEEAKVMYHRIRAECEKILSGVYDEVWRVMEEGIPCGSVSGGGLDN
jgi:hypothetical protein